MLDVGFSELLLIAVVALVFIGPKDLPVVVRHVARFLNELRGMVAGLKTQMQQVVQEMGVDDVRQNITTIIDLEGKPQKAYDVRELEALKRPEAVPSMLPLPPADKPDAP